MGKALRPFKPSDRTREHLLEGVPLGSFRRRLAAFTVDCLLIAVIFMSLVSLIGPILVEQGWLDPYQDYNFQLDLSNVYTVILFALYFSLFHYFMNGQTPGKLLFGLRVVSLEHARMGFWHCVERALGYGASALEGGFGYFQVIWKSDRRATHDKIANTIVTRESTSGTQPEP